MAAARTRHATLRTMMQPDEGWGSRHRTVPTGPFQQPRPFFDRNAIGKRALKSKFIPLAAKYPAVRHTAVGAGGCSLDMAATTAKGGPVEDRTSTRLNSSH